MKERSGSDTLTSVSNSALRIGAALVLLLTTLGLADYFLKERPHEMALQQIESEQTASSSTSSSVANEIFASSAQTQSGMIASSASSVVLTESGTSMTSSNPRVVKKGVSTKKKSSVDVRATLSALQFIQAPTKETSILKIIAQGMNTETIVLLLNNDRAALFSWIENDDVKNVFSALKQALQEQFSPKLTGLIDETQTPENGPPVDILSFTDPSISPEHVVFLRVRNRLYEFHIAAKGEDSIKALIAELSK